MDEKQIIVSLMFYPLAPPPPHNGKIEVEVYIKAHVFFFFLIFSNWSSVMQVFFLLFFFVWGVGGLGLKIC